MLVIYGFESVSKIGADPLSFGVCATLYANHRRCWTPPRDVGFRESLCDSNWFINFPIRRFLDWHRTMLHVYGFEFRLINDAALNLPRVIGNFSRRLSRLAEKFEIDRMKIIPFLVVHVLLNNHDFKVQLIYSKHRDVFWSSSD